ncbi:MAG TPA: NAD(P)-dependent oxidoreductase [Rhizomicrobium sp.]
MLPIVLTGTGKPVGLAGRGAALERRRHTIELSGVEWLPLSPEGSREELQAVSALFVVGLPRREAADLARSARAAGVLVNVEDEPGLCDFFMPAIVRRGDLLISISTSGRAPGLAKLVRQWIEQRLGSEWGGRLSELGAKRLAWRRSGHTMPEVAARTTSFIAERGWLP